MSTTSKVMYSMQGFFGVPNDMGRVMTLTGSIIFPLKPYRSFVGSLSCFLVVTHLFKGCEEEDFGLATIVNENFGNIPSVDVDGDNHAIGMRE
jgi:hypothetical protein